MLRHSLILSALLAAAPAAAQEWDFQATVYAWLPAMDVKTDTSFGSVDSGGSGGDVLSALDMAFMGTFQARYSKWSLIGDVVYADLSNSDDTPVGLFFDESQVKMKLAAFSGYALYRAYETERLQFDVGGGFRYFGLELDTTLYGATSAVADRNVTQDANWTDPLIAGRVITPINDRWFATLFADAGGYLTQDSSTWQALATVGYRFSDRWSAQLGYRYMNIEKEISGEDVTVDLYGPAIGVSLAF